MSGLILLIIGLISLAGIAIATVYLGLKAWRLLKHGMRVAHTVTPLADQLIHQAATISASADGVTANAEQLTVNLKRLQASARRLQVASEALAEAAGPYRRLRTYLGR